jgi:hypothetical protein
MNRQEPDVKGAVETYEPPKWLEEVLYLSANESCSGAELESPSDAFRQRCREAAELASSIAKLRSERRRIGFVPMSLAEYIQGLMKVAGVQVATVLARFGIEETSLRTRESARKLARLAQELGISLREVLVLVRVGFVEKIDSAPVSLLLARHRSEGVRDPLGECEAVLALVEAEYDSGWLNELRRTEFEIRTAYKQGE